MYSRFASHRAFSWLSRKRNRTTKRFQRARQAGIESLERRELMTVSPDFTLGIGGPLTEFGSRIAFDGENNAYVQGDFEGTVDFDAGPGVENLTSNGSRDFIVAKYLADGSLDWARSFGGIYSEGTSDGIEGIAVDSQGNVYAAAYFGDTVDFGGFTLVDDNPNNGRVGVLMQLDSQGTVQWATKIGTASLVNFKVYETATTRALFVAGSVRSMDGTISVGGLPLSSSDMDGFLARLDADTGQAVWLKKTSGSGAEQFRTITVDSSGAGSLYVAGQLGGAGIFGPIALQSSRRTSFNGLIVKSDLDGNFQWAKLLASNTDSIAFDLVAGDGGVLVQGYFRALMRGKNPLPVEFGSVTATGLGGSDVFVTHLDAAGNVLWATALTSSGDDTAWGGIDYDSSSQAVFVGIGLAAPTNVGNSSAPAGAYLVQLAATTGGVQESWRLGPMWSSQTASGVNVKGIAKDSLGDIWVTGSFQGTNTFPDGTTLSSVNQSIDMFLTKFSNTATAAPAPLASAKSANSGTAGGGEDQKFEVAATRQAANEWQSVASLPTLAKELWTVELAVEEFGGRRGRIVRDLSTRHIPHAAREIAIDMMQNLGAWS